MAIHARSEAMTQAFQLYLQSGEREEKATGVERHIAVSINDAQKSSGEQLSMMYEVTQAVSVSLMVSHILDYAGILELHKDPKLGSVPCK